MSRAELEKPSVQRILLDKIRSSPCQMRSSMDPEALDRLAGSLRQDGQQRPVKVRPLPDGNFELVFGHRTVDAAKIAGMQMVQAIIEDLTDEEVMWAQYAENEYREDISDYDRAKWLRNMRDRCGYTQESVGERAGLSKQRVNQLLRMLQLESKLTAVNLQNISERQARAILQAPEEDQPSLVNYVELYLAERGEIPSASAIEYVGELARASENGKSRRRLLYEIEGEPAPYEGSGSEDVAAEEPEPYVEEHDLGWVFDAEVNGNSAGFLTRIATLTDEELEFCLAHETRPLNLQRLNEERDSRVPEDQTPRPLLKEPPTISPKVISFINQRTGEPVEEIRAKLMEEHGLNEEEAQAALQTYRETYPDIWDRCYNQQQPSEEEELLTAEKYVTDILHHNPEVKHAELVKATVEMFDDVSEACVQGLIDRSRKRGDIYASRSPTTLCPLCGRANAQKNRILIVLEAYEAQPGVTVVEWLKEALA